MTEEFIVESYSNLADASPEKRQQVARMGTEKQSMRKAMMKFLKVRPYAEADEVMTAILGAGYDCNNEEAIAATQIYKAISKGDTRAAEFVRDTSGQKPVDKIDIKSEVAIQRFESKVIEIVGENAIDVEAEVVREEDSWEL